MRSPRHHAITKTAGAGCHSIPGVGKNCGSWQSFSWLWAGWSRSSGDYGVLKTFQWSFYRSSCCLLRAVELVIWVINQWFGSWFNQRLVIMLFPCGSQLGPRSFGINSSRWAVGNHGHTGCSWHIAKSLPVNRCVLLGIYQLPNYLSSYCQLTISH